MHRFALRLLHLFIVLSLLLPVLQAQNVQAASGTSWTPASGLSATTAPVISRQGALLPTSQRQEIVTPPANKHGTVYAATRAQLALSDNFYQTSSPTWHSIWGNLPTNIGGAGLVEFQLDPFAPNERAWVAMATQGSQTGQPHGGVWRSDTLANVQAVSGTQDMPVEWSMVLTDTQIMNTIWARDHITSTRAVIRRLAVSPLIEDLVYVVANLYPNEYVYVGQSEDGGNTWAWSNLIGKDSGGNDLELSRTNPYRLWVDSEYQDGNAYKCCQLFEIDNLVSTPFGPRMPKVSNQYRPFAEMHIPQAGGDRPFLMRVSEMGRIYRLSDDESSWEEITAGKDSGTVYVGKTMPPQAFQSSPHNAEAMFYISTEPGGRLLWSSVDAGATWAVSTTISSPNRYVFWAQTPVIADSKTVTQNVRSWELLAAHASANPSKNTPVIWYSSDGGQSWENKTGDWWQKGPGHYGGVWGNNTILKVIDSDTVVPALDANTQCTGSTAGAAQETSGGPINTTTGLYDYFSDDLSFQTVAGPLTLQRTYSSFATRAFTVTLGNGWTYNHDTRLIFPNMPGGRTGQVLFKANSTNRYRFYIQSGSYKPFPGLCASLKSQGSEFVIQDQTQRRYVFDRLGRLMQQEDPQGHAWYYTYIPNGGPVEYISDQPDPQNNSQARFLHLFYDDGAHPQRLTRVKDHTNRQVSYGYDANNNLTSVTDVMGYTWSYLYGDPRFPHYLTEVRNPLGQVVERTEFDERGRAVRQFNGNGDLLVALAFNPNLTTVITTTVAGQVYTATHVYDFRHTLVNASSPLGRQKRTTYDANFRPTVVSNEAGQNLYMTWSDDGANLLSVKDAAGNVTTNTYDDWNNLTSKTDPLLNITRYRYAIGSTLMLSATNALGQTTLYTYTTSADWPQPPGLLKEMREPSGQVTRYGYNASGQRTQVIDALGNVTQSVYDLLGRLVDSIDAQGRVTHNVYDNAGRIVRTVRNYAPARAQNEENLYNIVSEYEYDAAGRRVTVTDTYGHATHYEYDAAGRLVHTTDAAGNVTSSTYDAGGRLLSSADALGHATQYEYDALGRQVATVDALGHRTTTTFHPETMTSVVTNAAGYSTTFYFDALGRVVKTVDAQGHFTTVTYDAAGHVTDRTDQLGHTTHYEYDKSGRQIKTIDPLNQVTQSVYDASGRLYQTIDALGHATTYGYDTLGRQTVITDTLGHATHTVYDTLGNRTATIDALGRTTRYEYDALGRLFKTIDPLGNQSLTTYDALGRRIASTDALGHTTTFEYDLMGRLEHQTDALGYTTSYLYDAAGNRLSVTGPGGHTITTAYDALNRPIAVTDALGKTSTTAYDALGQVSAVTNALGETTQRVYDSLGRLSQVIDPLGHTTQYTFDAAGNNTDILDANGVRAHFVYDALNRLRQAIANYRPGMADDARTNVRTFYDYDANSNRLEVRRVGLAGGADIVTKFTYDAAGRLESVEDPQGHVTTYAYNPLGQRTGKTNAANVSVTYQFDALGRMTQIDYPAPEGNVLFGYNALGWRTAMTDTTGLTTWDYDVLGRVLTVTHPLEGIVGYGYDLSGNRQRLTYPDGKQVFYLYNADNHLAQATDWDGQATVYSYDAAGRLQSAMLPNGISSGYAYDRAGRLVRVSQSRPVENSYTTFSWRYAYDALGNCLAVTETLSTQAPYAYLPFVARDDFNDDPMPLGMQHALAAQENPYPAPLDAAPEALATLQESPYPAPTQPDGMAQFMEAFPTPDPAPQSAWMLDQAGGSTLQAIHYVYDPLNRLESASYNSGENFAYAYDTAGNVLTYTQALAGGQPVVTSYTYNGDQLAAAAASDEQVAWNYAYDLEGRLVEVTPSGGSLAGAQRYSYSAAGYLVQTESHDGTAYQPQAEMVYNGLGQRQSMTAHAGGLSLATTYVLDSEQNAAPLMATANGQTTYYLYGLEPVAERAASWNYYLRDGLGSVRKLADSTGEIVLERSYTPWGDVLSQSGTLTPAHGYLGGWVDAATGLIYVGNGQYYDPATGRFLTRDAQPGQFNPYLPNRGDPTGLLIGPLALLVLVHKRKGKGNSKVDQWVVLLLVGLVIGITMTGCGPKPSPTPTPTPGPMPSPINTKAPGPTKQPTNAATTAPSPIETLVPTAPACPTPGEDLGEFLITHYIMPLESDPFFKKGSDPSYDEGPNPIYSPKTSSWADPYANVKMFDETTGQTEYHKHIYDFVYNMPYGVVKQGTGITKDGKYISIDYNRSDLSGPVDDFTFIYKEGGSCGEHQDDWKTVATKDPRLKCGNKVMIDAYPNVVFTVTDTGSQLKNDHQLDVFVGPMRWSDFYARFPDGSDYIHSKVTKVGSP